MTDLESRRFGVVRYPTYYVVIDKADDNNKIVFESRSRDTAHSYADKLNREVDEAKRAARNEFVCDHCGHTVRVAKALHSGGFRHDSDDLDASAEWCETADGFVRVQVDGCNNLEAWERKQNEREGAS